MATGVILSLGYVCLNACATVGTPTAERAPIVSASEGSTSSTSAFNAASTSSTVVGAVAQEGSRFSIDIDIQSEFNQTPSDVSETVFSGSLTPIDPVENFELTGFQPLNAAVIDLQVQRETAEETVVDTALSGEFSFKSDFNSNGQNFGLGIVPRFSVWKQDDFQGVKLGGELRFGQDFDLRGSGDPAGGWYFFVGTDDEALTIGGRNPETLALVDQITVGDLQAGLLIGGRRGQIILGVTRREFAYSDQNMSLSYEEDIAGISFTRRF